MSQIASVFCSGVFFGVALYITLVQQPAALEAGALFARRFFPPMYRRATRMQVPLAALGTLTGVWSWWRGGGVLWLVGALLLVAVVTFTLVRIRPVNNQLLAAARDPEAVDTEALPRRWGSLPPVRTGPIGLACF